MRRKVILLVSALLVTVFVAGVMISYNDPNASIKRAMRDCPAYATNEAIFMSRSGQNWIRASHVTEAVYGGGNEKTVGAPRDYPPRNNYIDDYIFDKMVADDIPSARLCSDEEFVRRAYLDLTGRIPSADDVRQFLASGDPDKRSNLIGSLLGTSEFVDRWTMFYGDLLKNFYGPQGLYYGRNLYHQHIKDFVQNDIPYDQFIDSLLAVPLTNQFDNSWSNAPLNFFARAWEPMVNQYDVIDNIVVDASRAFLGVPALCISCHNGQGHLEQVNQYLSRRERFNLWRLSSFFSAVRFQRVREGQMPNTYSYNFREIATNPPGYNIELPAAQGGIRPPRRVPPEGPVIAPNYFFTNSTPDTGWRQWRSEFVRFMVSDPQFGKAAVNNLWKELMTMGIIDPPDAVDLARDDQATHPELLARLGEDFANNGYSIRYIIQLIMNSTAYQLSAQFDGPWEGRYARYFARHFAKRMTAEQLADSIYKSTGIPGDFNIEGIGPVQWTMQFPDTSEPRGAGAENAYTRTFLNNFLRGNRNTSVRSREGSTLQALALMNNNLVHNRVRRGRGGIVDTLIDSTMTADEIIDQLFLGTISRSPTAEERTKARQMINANRAVGTEDLLLILWNKLDSIFY